MRKYFAVVVFFFKIFDAYSQNVGIGTVTPIEKLDVSGNLNINGNIKINGAAGTNGQTLMTNATGQTVWGDVYPQYKNVMVFYANNIWTIPANVTNVMVETWGGGGGGAAGGGGGSAVYYRLSNVTVIPGTTITVTIGTGGTGAVNSASNATNGGSSSIFFSQNGFTYTASGGIGGKSNGPGSAITIGGTAIANLIFFPGNGGEATTEEYSQVNATEFAKLTKYGNGGNSAYLNMGGGKGGFTSFNTTNSIFIKRFPGTVGSAPGAGGGAGEGSSGEFGTNGNTGFVLIWY